jgi:hypothetical protein
MNMAEFSLREQLSEETNEQLRARFRETQRRIEELRRAFMSLRSGGCALDRLMEDALAEQAMVETLLRERGWSSGV